MSIQGPIIPMLMKDRSGPLQIDEDCIYHGSSKFVHRELWVRCGCGPANNNKARYVGIESEIPHKDRPDFCPNCKYWMQWTIRTSLKEEEISE